MAESSGLRFVSIHNAATGSKNTDDEWIRIDNDGSQAWPMSGRTVTDQTATQQHVHIYHFPEKLSNGGGWRFEPGETIYVFTGLGDDLFIANPSSGGRPQFHLHIGRRAMVWNNTGDRVYLRNSAGTFLTVPYPVP